MAYVQVTTAEITSGAAAKGSTMIKYRDNQDGFNDGTAIADEVILNRHMGNDSIGQAEIADGAVHQSQLDISTEDDTIAAGGATQHVMTGGAYCLGVQYNDNNSGAFTHQSYLGIGISIDYPATFNNTYYLWMNSAAGTLNARTNYITASGPYDLGDGEVPLFVWVRLGSNNEIKGIKSSITPTWAYNGPTDIRADKVLKISGNLKKYKDIYFIDEDTGDIEVETVEISMDMKNRDMDIIPHPFTKLDAGDRVVMVDPVDTEYLLSYKKAGGEVNRLFMDDYIRLDNENINRSVPSGVIPSSFKWKNSRSRAGEIQKDKRLNRGPFAVGD